MIDDRPGEVSKFTTRLEMNEIILIREKFKQWINEKSLNVVDNKVNYIRHSRTRIFHCFEILLGSGMRIGELVAIPFNKDPAHRVIWSSLNKQYLAELIINTEKTCKKREVYLPHESYRFMVKDRRKYQKKRLSLTKSLVTTGFTEFAR